MNNAATARLILICLFAFCGAMVAKGLYNGTSLAIAHESSDARRLVGSGRPRSILATRNDSSVIQYVYNNQGDIQLDQGIFRNQPITDFTDVDYKLRLQLGTYPGDVRSDETGLPVVTLYDRSNDLKELLRLDGGNQSPLIILKSHNNNRLIMGLALNDSGEEPFLAYFDQRGVQHMLFGNY